MTIFDSFKSSLYHRSCCNKVSRFSYKCFFFYAKLNFATARKECIFRVPRAPLTLEQELKNMETIRVEGILAKGQLENMRPELEKKNNLVSELESALSAAKDEVKVTRTEMNKMETMCSDGRIPFSDNFAKSLMNPSEEPDGEFITRI